MADWRRGLDQCGLDWWVFETLSLSGAPRECWLVNGSARWTDKSEGLKAAGATLKQLRLSPSAKVGRVGQGGMLWSETCRLV